MDLEFNEMQNNSKIKYTIHPCSHFVHVLWLCPTKRDKMHFGLAALPRGEKTALVLIGLALWIN